MDCDIGMCVIGVSKTTYDSCCNTPQGQDAFIRSHMLESLRLLRVLHNNYRFKDQSPLLRSVSGLLSNAPTDSNYFKLLINYIRDERFPPVSSSTYIILICFAVLHVIILVSCFVTFIWPVFHYSSNQRSKKFWLVKLIAIGGHGQGDFHSVPLILFNSGALVAFSQVTESCLSIVYIFLTYFASQSVEFAENTSTRPWACAIALFQFYSCWFMAWTLLYTRICARNPYIDPIGNKKRSRRVFHPLSLNAFFCSIPVIVTVVSGIMIYELANSSSNLSTEWNSLNGILKAGSFAWESLHNSATSVSPSDALRFQMNITTDNLKSFVEGIEVSLRLKDNVFMDQLESLLWVIALSGTCLVYLFSYWTLLRLISGGIHKFKRRVEIGLISTRMNNSGTSIARTPAQVDVHEPLTSTTSLGSKIEVSPEQASIRRGFVHLAFHGAAMILAMLCTIGVRITLSIKSRDLNWHASWRAVGSWLTLISGTFAALAASFQCMRTILEFDIIIPVNPEIPNENTGNYCPALQNQQDRPCSQDAKHCSRNFESDKHAQSVEVYQ